MAQGMHPMGFFWCNHNPGFVNVGVQHVVETVVFIKSIVRNPVANKNVRNRRFRPAIL